MLVPYKTQHSVSLYTAEYPFPTSLIEIKRGDLFDGYVDVSAHGWYNTVHAACVPTVYTGTIAVI